MPKAKPKRKKPITKIKRFVSKLPWGTVGDVSHTTVTVARDSTNAVPIVASVCGGAVSLLDHGKRAKDIKKNAKSLLDRAAELAAAVDTGKGTSDASTSRAQAVKSLCHETQLRIAPLTRARWGSRLLHLHKNEDMIKDYHAHLDKEFQSFLVATITKTEHDISGIQDYHARLDKELQSFLVATTTKTERDISEIQDYHARRDKELQSFLVATTTKTEHDIAKIQDTVIQTRDQISTIQHSLIASSPQTDSEIKKRVDVLTFCILSMSTVFLF